MKLEGMEKVFWEKIPNSLVLFSILYGRVEIGNIGSNSVVDAGSIVTKTFGENAIVAGDPARVVRENIVWSNDGTEFFDRNYFDECIEQVAME